MRTHVTAALIALCLAFPVTPARRAAADDPAPAPESPPSAAPPGPTAPPATPAPPTGYESLFPFGARGAKTDVAKTLGGAPRQQAIEAGVRWLVAHQTSSGTWDPSDLTWCDGQKGTLTLEGGGKAMYAVGITGMALSALLGAGATDRGPQPAARVVASGLAYLRAKQDAEGCFGERVSGHYVYNHAFATLAFVEAFGTTGDAGFHAAAQRGLDFAALARNAEWAWRYGIKPGDNDTSIAGCMSLPFCAALLVNEAAEAAGREPPFVIDDPTFVGVRAWVDSMTEPSDGRVGYMQKGTGPARPADLTEKFPSERSEAITAIGVVLRQRLPGGVPDHDADMIRLGARLIADLPPAWTPGDGNIDLYYWYYGSLAMQRLGGDVGDGWMRALVDALVKGQRKDGDVCAYKGSWDDADPWGPDGGRIYSTSMAVLSLEAVNRFPRLAAGRPDLVAALQAKDTPPSLQAQLLAAVTAYHVGGAEKALIPYARSMEPEVRAAGAAAMARSQPSPFGVQVIGSMLTDVDVSVRRAAIQALKDLGPDAVPAIAQVAAALKDADPVVRALAAGVLASGGASAAGFAAALKPLLADPDAGVRVAAAVGVFRLAQDAAAAEPVLIEGTNAQDPATRAAAAHGLGVLGAASTHAAATLKPLLEDASSRVVVEAAGALWAAKQPEPRIVPRVQKCLGDADPEIKLLALRLAESMGADALVLVPEVGVAALRGPRSQREQALHALVAVGKGAVEAAPAIYLCRDGRSPALKVVADDALARLAFAPNDLLPVLTKGLESNDDRWARGSVAGFESLGRAGATSLIALLERPDSSESLRLRVIVALGRIGPESDAATPLLTHVLDFEKNADIRYEAVRTLGAIGSKGAGALDALVKRLDDVDRRIPPAAMRSVGLMAAGAPDAVLALAKVFDTAAKRKPALRIAAASSLAELGAAALPAVPFLVGSFGEEETTVPDAAVQALGRIGRVAIDALREKVKAGKVLSRRRAAQALAAIGPESKTALPELMIAFEDPDASLRDQVTWALFRIGKLSIKPLMAALKNKNGFIRAAAANALGQFGKDALAAIGALKTATTDFDPVVAKAAQTALDKLKAK